MLVILTPHIVRSKADAARLLTEESRRMDWLLGDIIKTHGAHGMAPLFPPPSGDGPAYGPQMGPQGGPIAPPGTLAPTPVLEAPAPHNPTPGTPTLPQQEPEDSQSPTQTLPSSQSQQPASQPSAPVAASVGGVIPAVRTNPAATVKPQPLPSGVMQGTAPLTPPGSPPREQGKETERWKQLFKRN